MGWNDEEEEAAPPRWREPIGWIGCLLAAVMPTVVLASLAGGGRDGWPGFVPALYIGLFTVMVLVVRPWTMR